MNPVRERRERVVRERWDRREDKKTQIINGFPNKENDPTDWWTRSSDIASLSLLTETERGWPGWDVKMFFSHVKLNTIPSVYGPDNCRYLHTWRPIIKWFCCFYCLYCVNVVYLTLIRQQKYGVVKLNLAQCWSNNNFALQLIAPDLPLPPTQSSLLRRQNRSSCK